MGFDHDQLAAASQAQHLAATDPSAHVRVIAGPGTGKSQTIQQRVCWLLDNGADPQRIVAVSFTRVASQDLGRRIDEACAKAGHDVTIAVSTLHALALRALRAAGRLSGYPAEPAVLQRWELENIFDAEFGEASGIGKRRRRDIRSDHEALWQTGSHTPPQVVPPDPPISDDERKAFRRFHVPRTQLYSCVLPGEIVRLCVEHMQAGTLDPADLLGIDHLIVDEFQDLNPMDLLFVHGLTETGARVFAAGDDDQSLYSFRFATPTGIQEFTTHHPDAGDHTLNHCFRCTPAVLSGAQHLIATRGDAARIDKQLVSMYESADPPLSGGLGCWKFRSAAAEAQAIARSCSNLIAAGMDASEIMILLAAPRRQAADLNAAMDQAGVPYAAIREHDFTDTDAGRAAYAMLTIVGDDHNYIAHRALLGVRKGVATRTCHAIAQAVIDNQRNYRELFYDTDVPPQILHGLALRCVQATADICQALQDWSPDEALTDRIDELCALVRGVRDDSAAADELRDELEELPPDMCLREVQSYMGAERDDDRRKVLNTYAARTGQDVDTDELVPQRVAMMTMHSSKGLSAQMVFIPGLEEDILPGAKRAPYVAQVSEAARMLYVSITRARLGCVLSYAERRMGYGRMERKVPSRFCVSLGGTFKARTDGISDGVAERTVELAARL